MGLLYQESIELVLEMGVLKRWAAHEQCEQDDAQGEDVYLRS